MHPFFETDQPVLFTGDVGGVRIGPQSPVVPPCPPPDIHVEDWLDSIEILEKSPAKVLFLTHYGQINDKEQHLDGLRKTLLLWAEWIKPYAEQNVPTETIIPLFENFVENQLRDAGVSPEDIEVYNRANPAFMSVAGLLRYWKKKWKN